MCKLTDNDILLTTRTARQLYRAYAADLPITDLGTRLSAAALARDLPFSNLAEILLNGDGTVPHLMRACGADSRSTGEDAADYDRFRAWCACMPALAGHPLYLLHHLALRRFFSCDLRIEPRNCDEIWAIAAARLTERPLSPRNLLAEAGVKHLLIAEDPAADLAPYADLAAEPALPFTLLPIFAPDRLFTLDRDGIAADLRALGKACGREITDLASLEAALTAALDRFADAGCHAARHTLRGFTAFVRPDPYHAEQALHAALRSNGRAVTAEQRACFTAQLMRILGREYCRRHWTLQLTIDGGHDSALETLWTYLADEGALPRTLGICADTNPLTHRFDACAICGEGTPATLHARLSALASTAPLGKCLGPVSGAHAYLLPLQHDVFRRVLCARIGEWVEAGLYPDDPEVAGDLIAAVCCRNTEEFLTHSK